jgi:hypothetical protein
LSKQKKGLVVWVASSSCAGGTPPYLAPYFAAKAEMDALAVVYEGGFKTRGHRFCPCAPLSNLFASGQTQTTGRIAGAVRDVQGAVVAGAVRMPSA